MKQGLYIIFEGNEAVGKSTTMKAVADAMQDRLDIRLTHHPGYTALGAYLRKLVKYTAEVDADIELGVLSRQCLYMADAVNFNEIVLNPALANGETIFADRTSFISGLVYAICEDLPLDTISRLLRSVDPPKADRLYILQCPYEVIKERLQANRSNSTDYFDTKPDEFLERVNNVYNNLLTSSPEMMAMVSRVAALDNVVYIDSSQPRNKIVEDIVNDLDCVLSQRSRV